MSLCRRCMCLLTRVWQMLNCVIITDLNLWWTLICFRYWKEQEEWIVEKLFLETDAESQFEILMTVGSGNLLGVMKLSCSNYLKLAKKVSSDYFGKKILKWSFQCCRLVLFFVDFMNVLGYIFSLSFNCWLWKVRKKKCLVSCCEYVEFQPGGTVALFLVH